MFWLLAVTAVAMLWGTSRPACCVVPGGVTCKADAAMEGAGPALTAGLNEMRSGSAAGAALVAKSDLEAKLEEDVGTAGTACLA